MGEQVAIPTTVIRPTGSSRSCSSRGCHHHDERSATASAEQGALSILTLCGATQSDRGSADSRPMTPGHVFRTKTNIDRHPGVTHVAGWVVGLACLVVLPVTLWVLTWRSGGALNHGWTVVRNCCGAWLLYLGLWIAARRSRTLSFAEGLRSAAAVATTLWVVAWFSLLPG